MLADSVCCCEAPSCMPAGFAYTKIFLRGLLDRWNVKPYFFAHKWALAPDNLWHLSVLPAHAPVAL